MTFAEKLLMDAALPPALAAFVWMAGTGWSAMLYSGNIPESAKRLGRVFTLVVLVVCWLAMFGITLYAHFTGWPHHPH